LSTDGVLQNNLDREDEDALKADSDGCDALRDAIHALEETRASSLYGHLPVCKTADRLNTAIMAAERREAERLVSWISTCFIYSMSKQCLRPPRSKPKRVAPVDAPRALYVSTSFLVSYCSNVVRFA
jgi:hypothetical protein